MHVSLIVKFLEVEAAQVDDMAWSQVRLLVKDVHHVVMEDVMARHPRLRQLSHLD